jgi:aminopeptidase N
MLQGIDLYFERHDEQAVTCEDFFAAMRDANNADFANFLQWLVRLLLWNFL